MKKYSIFALVLALSLTLCACGRRDTGATTDTTGTTGMTMPTIMSTTPSTEEHVPGTTFQPDEDGIIGDTQGTENTTGATGGSTPDARMHLG